MNRRSIPARFALTISCVVLSVGWLTGCTQERTVEAYCAVVAKHKDRYLRTMSSAQGAGGIESLLGVASAVSDLRSMWSDLAKAAPAEIEADTETVRDTWDKVADAALDRNWLKAAGYAVMGIGPMQRVDAYVAQNCGAEYSFFGSRNTSSSGAGSQSTSGADGSAEPTDPSSELSSEPTTEPTETPSSSLPQADNPLPDDMMVVRRDDGGKWRIETLRSDGQPGTVLVEGKVNRGAALTPDRRTVLYLQEYAGSVSLRAISVDGSGDQELFTDGTRSCPRLGQPAINADGLIAVACLASPHNPGTLNLMSQSGALVRVLDHGRVGDPTFSPDGSSVVYWRSEEPAGEVGSLYRAPVDGSTEPELLWEGDQGGVGDPVYSPDGEHVAVTRQRGQDQQIAVIDLSAAQPKVKKLTSGGQPSSGPSWSPDGSRIAFRRGNDGLGSVWVMNDDGTGRRRLIDNFGYLSSPVWTAH